MRAPSKLLVLVALSVVGCTSLVRGVDEVPAPILPDPAYEELFSTYVELCAVSQFRSLERGEGGRGQPHQHGCVIVWASGHGREDSTRVSR